MVSRRAYGVRVLLGVVGIAIVDMFVWALGVRWSTEEFLIVNVGFLAVVLLVPAIPRLNVGKKESPVFCYSVGVIMLLNGLAPIFDRLLGGRQVTGERWGLLIAYSIFATAMFLKGRKLANESRVSPENRSSI